MSSQKTSLILRLDIETKEKFDHYCKTKGVSISETIRQFIDEKVGSAGVGEKIDSVESRWKVVNTRLTQSEYQSLIVRVQTENTTVSKWLLRLIRERIIDAPQLRAEEIQAITQALYRLQSVGRNLNQLVKYLYSVPIDQASLDTEELVDLKESIQETTRSITNLIKAASVRDFDYV